MKKWKRAVVLFLAALFCISKAGEIRVYANVSTQKGQLFYEGDAAPPSGNQIAQNERAVIDYSHTADGYVTVNHPGAAAGRLKAQVTGPSTTYTYDMTPGAAAIFPLSDGNGDYKVTVLENVVDKKYATVLSCSFQVTLRSEFEPFLHSNQYVNYSGAVNTIAKAAELAGNESEPLAKVEKIYNYVVRNLTYDKQKAANVKSGYLPALDNVLAAKTGICFDYAALMAGMLRSQGVPCKLVVGYAGKAYHAWISVWTEAEGWIDNIIYFDGTTWHRMDPTFASAGGSSDSIMEYIGDGSHYTAKYLY